MATDLYPGIGDEASTVAPCRHAAAVTPSDSAALTTIPKRLLIGVAGDIKVDTLGGESAVVLKVPAGYLDLRVTKVYSTSTTATNISALW
jgi:hypothetical protein